MMPGLGGCNQRRAACPVPSLMLRCEGRQEGQVDTQKTLDSVPCYWKHLSAVFSKRINFLWLYFKRRTKVEVDSSNWALGVGRIQDRYIKFRVSIRIKWYQCSKHPNLCLCPSVFYSSTVRIEHNILRIEGLEQYSEPNSWKIELVHDSFRFSMIETDGPSGNIRKTILLDNWIHFILCCRSHPTNTFPWKVSITRHLKNGRQSTSTDTCSWKVGRNKT